MIRKLSLLVRLTLGFMLLLTVTLVVGGLGIYEMTSLSNITQKLHDYPFTVTNSLHAFRGDVLGMRAGVLSIISGETKDVAQTTAQLRELDRAAQKHLDLAGERYLGPKSDFSELRSAYAAWKKEAFDTLTMMKTSSRQEAMRHQREDVAPQRERLLDETERMVEAATQRADHFMKDALSERERARNLMAVLLFAAAGLSVTISVLVIRSLTGPVRQLVELSGDLALGKELRERPVPYMDDIGRLETAFNAIITSNNQVVNQARTIAGGVYTEEIQLRSDDDSLGISLRAMTEALARRERESAVENWLKTGQNDLNDSMRGTQEIDLLAAAVVKFLAERLHGKVGCLYLIDNDRLQLQGTYACAAAELPATLALGEGLMGQAADDRRIRVVEDLPENYLRISSAVGEMPPRHLLIAPFMFQDRLLGVVELASLDPFDEVEQELASRACAIMGPAFNIAVARREMERLLQTTVKQAEELKVQQEELAAINEELEEQAEALRVSDLHLKEQREELRATNEELEEKTQDLELQRERLLHSNLELEEAQRELEQKAHDLETASRYKSDFLANMSHELRTPLNSLLILARDLMENRNGNLSNQQVESAEVIHRSGIDLLNLINDILDLAKIEAGRMDVVEEEIALAEVADALKLRFIPVARKKGIEFRIALEEGTPETMMADRQRLEQILNNLVSNAIKFTDRGGVEILFAAAATGSGGELSISVRDTGIGIADEKLQTIFETFRQADSGTSRRYGGTGLGLAIARNIAQLLGGSIEVESVVGEGSLFILRLPLNGAGPAAPVSAPVVSFAGVETRPLLPQVTLTPPEDDRDSLEPGDRSILIVEDDPVFAATLREVCRTKEFKAICALTGEEGLRLVREHRPTAIILDLRLPGMNGWQVLENLKGDTVLRHIPVHIVSSEEPSRSAYTKGAAGYLTKPASREELEESLANLEKVIDRRIKELLLVEDDDDLRLSIEKLIANDDIVITSAASGAAALAALKEKAFDCMVLDLGLPDMSGFELLKLLRENGAHAGLPVVVYTGRELSREEERELRQVSEAIIVKGARSAERLVDETSIFLHRVVSNLNKSQQQHIINLHDRDFYLHDKVVLLVDDDMRNLFALSKVLEQRGLKVVKAEDGEKALSVLRDGTEVDIILMDIMMPGVDGYETTRSIRSMGIRTPVIALTAKAMKEDRDKCLAAGADDYLAKPVDMDRLMSMMRVWLYA